MGVIVPVIYLILLIAQALVLLTTLVQRRAAQVSWEWILSGSLPVLLVTALQLIPPDWGMGALNRPYLIWLVLIVLAIGYTGLVLHDLIRGVILDRARRLWMALSLVWLLAFGLTALLVPPSFTGWANWGTQYPMLAALIGSVGGIAYSLFIIGLAFYIFYIAPMPEVANRAAFWIVTSGIYMAAVVLIASGNLILMVSGSAILLLAMVAMVYGITNYRLVDVRDTVIAVTRSMTVIAISWALLFATLYFLTRSNLLADMQLPRDENGTLLLAGIALAISGLIVPARQVIGYVFGQIMLRSRPNLASATAQYSQRVARASTLEDVVNATTETLNDVMGVRRSALILINNTVRVHDAVELVVLEMGASINNPSGMGYLHKQSPIFRSLALEKVPLGQYDIDYGPAFRDSSPQERLFFRDMHMSAYVPVQADNRLIGLLASGPKINDTPYYREDIEMLSVIAQQVGNALRSARLIDDLQHLNDSMRVLNKRLESAKMELEKLDTVKTDFITIASHELRTPLAQIRGYTDIIDSLNEAGNLKSEQANNLVRNLRKSAERMEELISAMLDVSQIDVNSMDLRFVRTTPETVIKMALEPLRDPASERNITITRHPSPPLPSMEADLQRMVQALRNIVLNAIKFTPDGGHIEISAELEPAADDSDIDHILYTIKDTGVGIAEKDLEFIFNKFYRGFDTQLHSTGIYKFMGAGPGLGLTIAKGIIEGHGGRLWAESEGHSMDDPPGSTFYVRLPLRPPAGTRRVLPFEEDTQGIPDLSVISD